MPKVEVSFTYEQALSVSTTLGRAIRSLEQVMKEDQGTKFGRPGTLGHEQRNTLIDAKAKIDGSWISS